MKERDGLRTALLISGGGTTMDATLKASGEGQLEGIIPTVVIASKHDAEGIKKATSRGVQVEVVARKDFGSSDEFGEALLKTLERHSIELVFQQGWLPLTPAAVVSSYEGRIVNQHPAALDPGGGIDFGGKGMHGSAPIAAQIAYSWASGAERVAESTVHFVTENYDEGLLIRVAQVPFGPYGSPVTVERLAEDADFMIKQTKALQKRLLPVEHDNVIEALRIFGSGDPVVGFKRAKPLITGRYGRRIAQEAKELAVNLFPHG